jgi:RNA methyltransferase, TrmH family
MLSKSQLNYIKSLHHKKHRKQEGKFLAEGLKTITEFMHSDYAVDCLFHTKELPANFEKFPDNLKLIPVSESELTRISTLQHPQGELAIIRIPEKENTMTANLANGFSLALDGIQDPGNMGTLIRTADWFGIRKIFCSEDCVEVYNPKVVQASMGSLARIQVVYTDLGVFIKENSLPVYAAALDGDSLYDTHFEDSGVILLGNEGKGIREALTKRADHLITIPRYGKAESLNVGIAGAIICSELSRQLDIPEKIKKN